MGGGTWEKRDSFRFEDLTTYPAIQWIGLSPDGAPLLLRDVGTSHLYALRLGTR